MPAISFQSVSKTFAAGRGGTGEPLKALDQLGRVNAILPTPKTKGQVSNLCFGGKDFDTMYVTCHDKVFKRKFKVPGVNAFEAPVKPKAPVAPWNSAVRSKPL